MSIERRKRNEEFISLMGTSNIFINEDETNLIHDFIDQLKHVISHSVPELAIMYFNRVCWNSKKVVGYKLKEINDI